MFIKNSVAPVPKTKNDAIKGISNRLISANAVIISQFGKFSNGRVFEYAPDAAEVMSVKTQSAQGNVFNNGSRVVHVVVSSRSCSEFESGYRTVAVVMGTVKRFGKGSVFALADRKSVV